MENLICKKVSFVNEEQALFYINKLNRTSKRNIIPQRAYLCEKCLTWHLTSIINNKDKMLNILQSRIDIYLKDNNMDTKFKLRLIEENEYIKKQILSLF